MSDEYIPDKMSTDTKAICERGKFFIETGTVNTFNKFLQFSDTHIRIRRDIPQEFLNRIVDLISEGDRDGAIILWTRACQIADVKPTHRRRTMIFLISYLLVAGMALYAFLKVI